MAERSPQFIDNVDWAKVQDPQVDMYQAPGTPPVHSPGGYGSHEQAQDLTVTSSGARTWDETLQHWGVAQQGNDLPSDVRTNVLPSAYDAARSMHSIPQPQEHGSNRDTRYVTSSGQRSWDEQRRHWGLS